MQTSIRQWLPLAGLALFAALVVYLIRPPRPVAAGAPTTEFAAGRAIRDVAAVAQRPHGLGSTAQADVQAYILRRCRRLGLQLTVQDTSVLVAKGGQTIVGRVQNIIARLPGREPGGKAVLVLAHYDSQPHTPGAGDDAAGVAAMLETIRALRTGPPLAHDVIWLFTDGEEAGLLGARAYAADTVRLRREVGVALNFEGRGNGGPSLTFEVSPQNGWVMREYARAVARPLASSLFYEAYRHLPNDTDFTPLRQAGVTGLNFAYVGGYSYYHSPADTPAHLDLGSLQHQGDYMLRLVRHFGSISLTQTKAPDYTFFNPIGTWLVRYPATWNLPLTLATVSLLLGVAGWTRSRHLLSWPALLGSALAWLGSLVLALAAGWGLLAGIRALYPQYGAFYDGAFYNVLAYQVALLALAGAVFAACYGWLSQRGRPDALVGGALLVVALLLGLLQWQAPSSAFLLAFPLLFAVLAWAGRLRTAPAVGHAALPTQPGALSWLLALPVVALLGQIIYLLLVIFGLGPLVLLADLLLALLLGLLLPQLLPVLGATGGGRRVVLPGLGVVVAVVALAVGHATSQPTAQQPQQTHLLYTLDADHGRAYWLTAAARPDAWTRQVLTQPQRGPLPALLAGSTVPILHQVAPVLGVGLPSSTLLSDSVVGGSRQLRLVLRPGRPNVSSLRLDLGSAAQLRSLRLAGHLVPISELHASGSQVSSTFFAPRSTGEVIEVGLASGSRLHMVVTIRSLGLPAVPGLPSLPPTFIPAPGYNSFTTQVKREFLW